MRISTLILYKKLSYSRRSARCALDNISLQPSTSADVPISKPASYRRFSSPQPPKFKLERKMSAGILRSSTAEPVSPAPSADRLSVTFAFEEPKESTKGFS